MSRAVLAAVQLTNDTAFASRFEECRRLCEACGIEVAGEIVQKSRSLDAKTAFRQGKIEERANMTKALEADCVIFGSQLSIAASARLSAACGVPVKDRTALILDIFSLRARSAQAKMQVELARLEYAMPALIRDVDEAETHQRGGSAVNRGAGETRAAGLRRKYQNRITELKKRLASIEKRDHQASNHRNKSGLKRAALAGYTNAGKSSLLNSIMKHTGSQAGTAEEKDMLFATLDTSIRRIDYDSHAFFLYDTVGFVSDLPHGLVEAFRSTLSAVTDADLIIEVIDGSDPEWQTHVRVTEDTLNQIGAGDIEVLRVFNKIDLCDHSEFAQAMCVSCRTGEGIEELTEEIIARLYPEEITIHCLIPYERMAMIRNNLSLRISILESYEDGMMTEISGERVRALPFMKYQMEETDYEYRMGQIKQ